MRIPDPLASGYVLRYPFQRGGFNTVGYVSPQEFLGDLEALYATVLRDELEIEREELKVSYSHWFSSRIRTILMLGNEFIGLLGHLLDP